MFHVLTTWHPDRRRANLLVVVDVSGSMADPAPGTKKPLISLVSQGVEQVGALMPDDSRVGLWEFGARLDAPRDYRVIVADRPLDAVQRDRLNAAARKLKALNTGTGLYDTILAAYRAQLANFSSDMPTEVMVFTDGRNEDDPNSISLTALRKALASQRPKPSMSRSGCSVSATACPVDAPQRRPRADQRPDRHARPAPSRCSAPSCTPCRAA